MSYTHCMSINEIIEKVKKEEANFNEWDQKFKQKVLVDN